MPEPIDDTSSPDISAVAPADVSSAQPNDTQPVRTPSAPTPDVAAPPISSLPPSAPPDLGQPTPAQPNFRPGVLGRLKSFIEGLAEGGIPGAVQGGIEPRAAAAVRTARNQTQAASVRFLTAQAAKNVAQAAADEYHLRHLPDELAAQHDEAARQTMQTFHQLGLPLVSISDTTDDGTSAMTQLAAVAAKSPGGQFPHTTTVQMNGKAYTFSLDRAAGNLETVNKLRQANGLPAFTSDDYNALTPEQKINALDSAARIFSEPFTPKAVTAQLANLQAHKDLFNATVPDWRKDKAEMLQRFDARIAEAKNTMAFFDAHDRQKAAIEAATRRVSGKAPDGTWDAASLPVGLVEGTIDPSQLSKRGSTYGATLEAANRYSLEKTGKPFDIAQASSDYKFATSPQTQNTLRYLNSLTGSDNKSGNLGALVAMSDGISRTNFPALNKTQQWANLESGDPNIAAYKGAITEVADQVAKILQGGGTGSGTSDAKLKQAQDLFNVGFSKDQVKSTADTLRNLLGNRKAEMIGGNRYLLRQFGGSTPQNSPAQQQQSAQPRQNSSSDDPFARFGGRLK